MSGQPRTRCSDDRGVAAALVAVGIIMLLAIGAFTVDLGRAWATRRHLITATDAAALAAAQDYAFDTDGCADTAPDYLADNYSGATLTECDAVAPSSRSGHVTVDAEISIDHFFAGAIGLTSSTVDSTTTAHWGPPASVTGLRPIGLCIDVVLEDLNPPMVPGNGVVYVIPYGTNDQTQACGGSPIPGNWGVIDFNGGSNPNNTETAEWISNGYPGPVSTGVWYEGSPGTLSTQQALADLADLDSFDLPVFDAVTGQGGQAEFYVVAFAKVRLVSYQVTGSQNARHLRIEFLEGLSQGTVGGGGTGPDFGVRAIAICSVLPGDVDDCV